MSPPTPLRTNDDLNIPHGERKTVATLLADDCRWPFGDPLEPDFHFCGKRKMDGNPYCEFHMLRAFNATRARAVGVGRPGADSAADRAAMGRSQRAPAPSKLLSARSPEPTLRQSLFR